MRQSAQPISPLPDESAPREAPSQEIEYAPAVMEAIRNETVAGLMRLGRGGIEVGGVLFGRNTSNALRILAARPLECEHRFGPSFVLSETDENLLRQMIDPERRDEETQDLEPVGWYVSHCRRTFALDDRDIRVFDRYFPKPGSVALIVMPDKIKPTRACFFVRDPKATMRLDVPSCEVLLPSPVDLALAGPTSALPSPPLSAPHPSAPPPTAVLAPSRALEPLPPPQTSLAPVNAGAVDNRDVAARRLQTFLAQQEKHRRISTWNLWATIIVLLLCTAGAGYLWIRSNNPEGPPAIPLHVSDSGAQIRIEWDAKLRSVETANAGVLEMRESDGTAEQIKLPPDALRTGSAYYSRRTDKVEIRLKLVYADKPAYESVVYFIHPVSSPASSSAPLAPLAPTPQTLPAQVPPDAKAAEIKPVKPRVFQPPVMSGPSSTAPVNTSSTPLPSPDTMPSTRPPQLNLPLSAVPVIAPPPPAPAPKTEAPARTEPPRPRSGRLIWTGELGRNALLSLSPAGASLGWVNGRLPGFPVHVSVHIAQLVEGGIEVYTEDSKSPTPAEPPSAQNGWNIVVYKPDTKRIAADLRIVEAPSAANSWNQMVVQNGKRPVSVLVIDWERSQ